VNPSDELTYQDFALAVLDELNHPTHHQTQLGIA